MIPGASRARQQAAAEEKWPGDRTLDKQLTGG
jgi:hypothetical protein